MGLGEYACPLCGWKVNQEGRLFIHDKDIGAFICGECKSKIIKMKREENLKSDKIGEYKRRLKDFRESEIQKEQN